MILLVKLVLSALEEFVVDPFHEMLPGGVLEKLNYFPLVLL
jgi:hypothetical protein